MDETLQQLFSDASKDIGKQDILQLLSVAIKENQPIGKHFAQTVLSEIEKKLKDIKIKSTPFEIDGKSISKDINKDIQDGISKSIDDTIKIITTQISDSTNKVSAKESKGSLSISSLLGQSPELSTVNRKKYQEITTKLLDGLSTGIPKKIDLGKHGISVGDIFKPSGDASSYISRSSAYQKKWSGLQNALLDKITTSLPTQALSFKEIGIGDIFRPLGPTGNALSMMLSRSRFSAWNKMQNSIMDKVSKSTSNIEFKEVGLNEIMGSPPKTNSVNRIKWSILQWNILSKISESIPEEFSFKEQITFNDIMGVTPQMGLFTKLRWGMLQRKLLKKASDAADNPVGIDDKKLNIKEKGTAEKSSVSILDKIKSKAAFSMGDTKEDGKGKGAFKSLEERANPVEIVSYSKTALDSMAEITGGKISEPKTLGSVKGGEGGKISSGIMKYMAPIIMIIGSLGALAMGLMSTGPAKGLMTMLGKGGLMAGLKMLAKQIGGKLLKTLTFIPFVGTLIDFADAFMRFKQKDFVGGTIALVGGLASLINIVAPGVGTALSLGAGALNAFLDYKAGGAGPGKNAKKLDLLGDGAKAVGRFIMKGLRHLPLIGTAIQLYEAYQKFKSKDYGGGIMAIVGGLATLVPGYGSMLSIGVGVLSNMLEKKAAAASTDGKKVTTFDLMKGFIVPIKDKIVAWFKNTSIFQIGSGIFDIFKGDIVGGFGKIASVLSGIPIIGPAFSMLNSWLGTANEKVEFGKAGGKPVSLFTAFKDVLFKKIKKGLKGLPYLLRQAMKFIPGLGDLLGKDDETEPTDASSSGPTTAKSKKDTAPDVAQDFVWRKGQRVQKFSSDDNIISTKDNKKFDQMVDAMRGSSDKNSDMNQSMSQLHKDVNKLIETMTQVMRMLESDNSKPTSSSAPPNAGLPGISEEAGTMRDPAYVLRSRAWDRIRKGYVVL